MSWAGLRGAASIVFAIMAELPHRKNELIIMIERNGEIIIPNGDVVLQPDDMLVINRSKPHV